MLAGVELGFLWVSPVYLGYGIPRGDGSGVVLVPGFLASDRSLKALYSWLKRIGYRSYYSGISINAECPNLLIGQHLRAVIEKAYEATNRRVHVIGHSLGGAMARAVAAQMPERIASVITLASPIRSVAAHSTVLRMADVVREQILNRHGAAVLPNCYTTQCTCNFLASVMQKIPKSVRQTAIYSKCDGIMDWRACQTGDPRVDVEVSSTHVGLVVNPLVYQVLAERLAASRPAKGRGQHQIRRVSQGVVC